MCILLCAMVKSSFRMMGRMFKRSHSDRFCPSFEGFATGSK
jgi:hypothetical protein